MCVYIYTLHIFIYTHIYILYAHIHNRSPRMWSDRKKNGCVREICAVGTSTLNGKNPAREKT